MEFKCQLLPLVLGSITKLKLTLKLPMLLVLDGTMLTQPMTTVKMALVAFIAKDLPYKLRLVRPLEIQRLREIKFSSRPRFQDVASKVSDMNTALKIPRPFTKKTLMSLRLIKLIFFWFISHHQEDVAH